MAEQTREAIDKARREVIDRSAMLVIDATTYITIDDAMREIETARAEGYRQAVEDAAGLPKHLAEQFEKLAENGGRKSRWNATLAANFKALFDDIRTLSPEDQS